MPITDGDIVTVATQLGALGILAMMIKWLMNDYKNTIRDLKAEIRSLRETIERLIITIGRK